MVFRRRRGKRSFRRRSFRRRNKSTRSIAKRAWKKARRVSSLIEVKRLDIDTNTSPSDGAVALPDFILLNGLVQGTSVTTRVGEHIAMRSIQITVQMYRTHTVNTFYQPVMIHMLLFIDKQTNSSTPNLQDIFTFAGGYPPTVFADALPLRNWQFRNRFKILKHKVFNLQKPAQLTFTSAGAPVTYVWDSLKKVNLYKKLRGKRTLYSGSGALIGNITKNPLYLVFWSNQSLTITDTICDIRTRLTFWDA